MLWDEDQETVLADKWKAGETAAAIARFMSVSRNSVIGKVCRLGLQRRCPRPPKIARSRVPRERKSDRPRKDSHVPAPPPRPRWEDMNAPTSRQVSLAELRDKDCAWPHGDGPFFFCGAPVGDITQRYCYYHQLRSRQPGSAPNSSAKVRRALLWGTG